MRCQVKRLNRVVLMLVIIYAVGLTGCSAYADFVVINASDSSIDITYKVKKSTVGRLVASGPPAVIEVSQLSTRGGTAWEQLNSGDYRLSEEPEVDVVSVQLPSQHALRLTSLRLESASSQDSKGFPITEIVITGPNGKSGFSGDRARTGFSELSRSLYAITYKFVK